MAKTGGDYVIQLQADIDTSYLNKRIKTYVAQTNKSHVVNDIVFKPTINEKALLETAQKVVSRFKNVSKEIKGFGEEYDVVNKKIKQFNELVDTGRTKKSGERIYELKEYIQYVETLKDALGSVVERTTIMTKGGKEVSRGYVEIKKGLADLTTTTDKYKQSVNGIEQTVTRQVKEYEDASGQLKTIVTETKQYTDAQGYLVKESQQFEQSIDGTEVKLKQLGASMVERTKDTSNLTSQVDKMVQSFRKLESVQTSVSKTSVVEGGVQKDITSTTTTQNGKSVTQEVSTFINTAGQLVEETRLLDSAGNALTRTNQKIIADNEKVASSFRTVKTEISKSKQTITENGKQVQATVTTTEKWDKANRKLVTELIEFENEEGKIVQRTRTMLDGTVQIGDTIETVAQKTDKSVKVIKTLTGEYTKILSLADGTQIEKNITATQITDSQGKLSTKEITQYIDEMGRLVTEERVFDNQHKQVGETVTTVNKEFSKVAGSFKAIKTETSETNRMLTINGKQLKATVTTTKQYNSAGQQLTTTVTKYKNSLGETVTETRNFNTAGKQVGDTITEINREVNNGRKGIAGLGQSFSDYVVRVAKFRLANLPIQAFQLAITTAKEAVVDFDKAITELKKVTDVSADSLDSYVTKLGELGKDVARTKTEMVQATTEFTKSGFSAEDSAQLARINALYQNIADEELNAADASAVLISQIKAFYNTQDDLQNIEDTATHVIDAINEVANNFAVSSGDIGRGLTQAGAALSTYGNSYEQTIALVTAGSTIDLESRTKTLLIDWKLLRDLSTKLQWQHCNGNA